MNALPIIFIAIVYLAVAIFMIAGMWKAFEKAGKPGWACIVPIYNIIILLEIAQKPAICLLLMFLPIVNFIILILLNIEIAKNFGKSGGFAVGLIFFPMIFWAILGFGDAVYMGQYPENDQLLDR